MTMVAAIRIPSMSSERAAADESWAQLEPLYRAQRPNLLGLAILVAGDREQAQDAVQEAFVATQRRWRHLADVAKASSYLKVATVNAARTAQRRRAVRARLDVKWASPDEVPADARLELAEEYRAVARAVARLPRRQQQVVTLRYWAQMPDDEVANALGISISSVRSHASRGVAALGTLLDKENQR